MALLFLRCLAAKSVTRPCWILHAPPRLLVLSRMRSPFAWLQPSHIEHQYWRHLRPSIPNLAICGFRGSLPVGTSNDIRQSTGIQALPMVGKEFSTTRHATTNPMRQGEKSCQRPQDTGIRKEDFEASGLKSFCGSCKNCKTYFNVHSVHVRGWYQKL